MKLAGILGHCMTTTELFQQSIKAMPPSASGSLRAPANFGAIQVANSRIEQQRTAGEIPEELAALWLLHDGQSEGDDAFPGFAFLPLAKAISEYSELCYLMKENDPDKFG
jgi:cell wall assembly regulator SMI1